MEHSTKINNKLDVHLIKLHIKRRGASHHTFFLSHVHQCQKRSEMKDVFASTCLFIVEDGNKKTIIMRFMGWSQDDYLGLGQG